MQMYPRDVRSLTYNERCQLLESIRVPHPEVDRFVREVEEARRFSDLWLTNECCFAVHGSQGVGKTSFIQAYRTYIENTGFLDALTTISPHQVLSITIPQHATLETLSATLLQELGDPYPHRGTLSSRTLRIHSFLRSRHVKVVLSDDSHYLAGDPNEWAVWRISEWLKVIIKEHNLIWILVGLDGADEIVTLNPQLGILFSSTKIFSPFRWDETDLAATREFFQCLRDIGKVLPLADPSRLDNILLARCIYRATGGVMAHIMTLIRFATYSALDEDVEALAPEHFMEAYNEHLRHTRPNQSNPFEVDSPYAFTGIG